ncbi:MAG TPA: MoxR family ATPase [Solirubrobacterales bacterium]|nr:MoxR family ATPase [Solirubrobacterales bacterium]
MAVDPVAPLRAAHAEPLAPEEFQRLAHAIEAAVARTVVGQEEAVRGALTCLACGGHALLEGVPGLGKTTMARALAAALDLEPKRIQFTPDLMPADITGTTVLLQGAGGDSELRFEPGPIFANVVLAHEINRAAPRTQSALLEAMQERTVTTAKTTRALPDPFFVIATQNPVEMYGTYPLPEAELDRFFLKLNFDFPPAAELNAMVARTTGGEAAGLEPVDAVADAETVARMRALVRQVPAAAHVVDYATRLVLSLHPEQEGASEQLRRCVRLGPSPRGIQALVLAGRVAALIDGRTNLAVEDVRAVAHSALRHRLVLTIDAERQGVGPDEIIDAALDAVPREA